MEHCEDSNGTMIYTRALQGHSHGVEINPDLFSLKKIPLNWKEHIFHTGTSCNYKSILENEWSMSRRFESKKHKTGLFLLSSESLRIVRTIDWKGLDDEPRMVLYKHSNRPDHDCIYHFDLRRAQNANLVFLKVAVTLFRCTTICRQTHWTQLSFLQAWFCSTGSSDFNQAGGDSLRTNWLVMFVTGLHDFGANLSDEQYQKRMQEQRYTQSDMEELRAGKEKRRSYTWRKSLLQSRQQHRKDRRTPWIQAICTEKKWKLWPLESRCRTVVIVVILDMTTFDTVFLVGLFLIIALMAEVTIIYLTQPRSIRPEQYSTCHRKRAQGDLDPVRQISESSFKQNRYIFESAKLPSGAMQRRILPPARRLWPRERRWATWVLSALALRLTPKGRRRRSLLRGCLWATHWPRIRYTNTSRRNSHALVVETSRGWGWWGNRLRPRTI